MDRLSGETCDDQNDDETDGCLSNCRRGSLCGDGFLDEGEDCDGEADTAYCTDECICDITFGEGVYQEPCTQASDCATGLCVEKPLASGSAFCTQLCESNGQCPDLDQCVSVGAPSPDICLQKSLGYGPGDIFSICMPNDTGYPCSGVGTDCPIGGVCYTPFNPAPFDVSVRSYCVSACETDDECPSGYQCGIAPGVQGGRCIPVTEELIACTGSLDCLLASFTLNACLSVTQNGGSNNGYCTAFCNTSNECPAGFGCILVDVEQGGVEQSFSLCLPFGGYRCTNAEFDCLSQACTPDPSGIGLGHCTGACTSDMSCPQTTPAYPVQMGVILAVFPISFRMCCLA